MLDSSVPNETPWVDIKASKRALIAATARNLSGRRRRIDPAICEKNYKADELEFMNAIEAYKKSSGRMFPTWSEVLEVLKAAGYTKNSD